MKTKDEISKIKAVVLYILQNMPDGVDYIHLFKVMYFAQQEHLVTYGMPLHDDTFFARKHGPVPSFTYKVLRGMENRTEIDSEELCDFAESLSLTMRDGHQIVSKADSAECDMDELSVSNVKILDKWIENCRNVDSFELSDLSHDKAWQKARRQTELTGEDTKIALYEIAKAGGATEAMLGVIRERQSVVCALR